MLLVSEGTAQERPASVSPPAQRPAYVQRPESELLLFDLRLGQTMLVEGLPAYQVVGGILAPLGEICRALDFAIQVDVTAGTADGFFISENRRFSLDTVGRRVTVEGKDLRFDPARIEVHQDDIYVDTQLLSEWFPMDLTAQFSTLLLTIRPREPLPVQKRQERERRAFKELASLGYQGPQYPLVSNPYRFLDYPFIDQTLRANVARVDGSSNNSLQYSTFATGDLLYHEASFYLFGDQHGVTDARGSLARRDPGAGLLGPLRAREYAAGDVLDPGLEAVSLPRSGPGLLLSNFPLQRQTQADRHTFRGDLPQGWEVELYRNGALLGFQQFRPDGRYEFDNVELVFGLNVFRLVFYGPQGQRREESSRVNLAESLTPAGQLYYRLVGNDPKDATRRGQLDLDFGVSRRFSISADLASVEPDDSVDQDCDGADAVNPDRDGDGVPRPLDCDDANRAIRPGAREIRGNRVDEDCNGIAEPFVRIGSPISNSISVFSTYTRFRSLTVRRVPRGARVELRCRGTGCPRKLRRVRARVRKGRASFTKRIRAAHLRRGATVEIRITRREAIGKVVRFRIRSRALPTSSTLCLRPGAKRPREC